MPELPARLTLPSTRSGLSPVMKAAQRRDAGHVIKRVGHALEALAVPILTRMLLSLVTVEHPRRVAHCFGIGPDDALHLSVQNLS